jgi:hypothetical protein
MGTATVAQPPATPPAAGRVHSDTRSQSPHGAGGSQVSEVSSAAAADSVTGFALGDRWFDNNVVEQQIRQEFFKIPNGKRKTINYLEVHGKGSR